MNSPITIPANYSMASLDWFTSKSGRWVAVLLFPLILGPAWCLAGQFSSSFLGTLSGLVLLAALVTSAVTDVRSQKIYNFVTYSAFLWAVLINIVAGLLATEGPAMLGGVGVAQSLVGAGLCFFITLLGYRLSGRGAGDVKLATVIGALLGVQYGVFAVFYSYIVAAAAIIAWSAWTQGPLTLLFAALRTFGALLGPLWPFPPKADDHTLLMKPIPLGPYFLIGTLLVVLEIVPL